MKFGERLKTLRRERGLNQRQLAEAIHVTPSCLSKWESGRMLPGEENLAAIQKALNINGDQLSLPPKTKPIREQYNCYVGDEEKKILRDYRKLDSYGKRAVLLILKNEKRRMAESLPTQQKSKHTQQQSTSQRFIPYYLFPAAAGYSAVIDDSECEMIPVNKKVPSDADFAVRIQGDSMLPYLHDGQIAYVKRADEVGIGDIGLFSVNGAQYSKMFYKTGTGDIWLVSTNENLANSNVLIRSGSNDSITCYGKIITATKPKLPTYFLDTLI